MQSIITAPPFLCIYKHQAKFLGLHISMDLILQKLNLASHKKVQFLWMLTEIATFLWDAKFIFCRIGSIEICNPRNLAWCLYIQRKGGLFSDILWFEAYFRFLDFKGSFLSLIFEFWKFRKLFWNQWEYLGGVCFLTFYNLKHFWWSKGGV